MVTQRLVGQRLRVAVLKELVLMVRYSKAQRRARLIPRTRVGVANRVSALGLTSGRRFGRCIGNSSEHLRHSPMQIPGLGEVCEESIYDDSHARREESTMRVVDHKFPRAPVVNLGHQKFQSPCAQIRHRVVETRLNNAGAGKRQVGQGFGIRCRQTSARLECHRRSAWVPE